MKTFRSRIAILALAALPAWSAVPRADVLPPSRREGTVEAARALARPAEAAPVPAGLQHPFDPKEPELPSDQGPAAGPTEPVQRAPADRELLATIASRIQPTGSIAVRGRALLTFSGRTPTVGVGQRFVVTYEDKDYELEVVAIDRTTFTLRYRGEEITRPIKPTR